MATVALGIRRARRERGCGRLWRGGMGAWLDQELCGAARCLRRGTWRREGRRRARLSRWTFHRAAWRRGEGEEDPLAPFGPGGLAGLPSPRRQVSFCLFLFYFFFYFLL